MSARVQQRVLVGVQTKSTDSCSRMRVEFVPPLTRQWVWNVNLQTNGFFPATFIMESVFSPLVVTKRAVNTGCIYFQHFIMYTYTVLTFKTDLSFSLYFKPRGTMIWVHYEASTYLCDTVDWKSFFIKILSWNCVSPSRACHTSVEWW